MSADILRRAAALMHERARWCSADGDIPEWYSAAEMGHILRRSEPEHSRTDYDAEHIASWHPLVALAVADWLDREARFAEHEKVPSAPDALAVARAYLGESS